MTRFGHIKPQNSCYRGIPERWYVHSHCLQLSPCEPHPWSNGCNMMPKSCTLAHESRQNT
ncbi:hypothetical protein CY34DRAFT_610580 [Suillus luteus UH-Slu-Lm8-n1]|uniref:Uncharacterized protein n=1 Tax=Suillus luteus UH-Slu-Lm8-n1 TaxID=930992 RepID=A0A0D0BEQ5_9AGAM|nr:hypothetical protein CY34DRAFT_610580 [Suillus luteus UH-Slu-Lm8-n1]